MDINAPERLFSPAIPVSFPAAYHMGKLQMRLVLASFFNLFLVSGLGILLRSFPFMTAFPLQYKNVLHAHSHFAFGGWVMPILIALILKCFPELCGRVAYKHWRNMAVLILLSAYGMLASFPFQGYGPVSIVFSALSVIAGYYLAIVLWRAAKNDSSIAVKFLKAGLFYLCLSSIGPFATGPLIAMGKAGTPLYHNAIYFYLHFQYNGWFVFALMAVFYQLLSGKPHHGARAFLFLNTACVPAYLLSVLWNSPGLVYNIVGGVAAVLQLAGVVYVLKDFSLFKSSNRFVQSVFTFAMMAFVLKNVLQAASAVPAVAHMAAVYRNFVIAYLHLVLLGFVSMFSMGVIFQRYLQQIPPLLKASFWVFLAAFIITELLLVDNAAAAFFPIAIPHFAIWILVFSCLFPLAFWGLWHGMKRHVGIAIPNGCFAVSGGYSFL